MLEEVAIFENLEAGRRISLIPKHSGFVCIPRFKGSGRRINHELE
jgi:hypothetical protein